MALPSSGTIKMSQVRDELKKTGPISLGNADVRKLGGKSSGTIKMSDLYGKSMGYYIKYIPWVYDFRTVTTGTNTISVGTQYCSGPQTTSNKLVLKYSGSILSNTDNLVVFFLESRGSTYIHLHVNGVAMEKLHKKVTVTRKVNGGSAITTTYDINSDNRISASKGSALYFLGIAHGAVVELMISGA